MTTGPAATGPAATGPAATFHAIAAQVPASRPQQAADRQKGENPYQNKCPICLSPLRPGQVHVPGGYECQEKNNEN